MSPTLSLRYLAAAALAILALDVLLTASVATSDILVFLPFMFTIATWACVLFGGTEGLALNFTSDRASRSGVLLSFFLFLSAFMSSFMYVHSVWGVLGEVAAVLLFLLALSSRFSNTKICGYRVILPFAFVGVAGIGKNLFAVLRANGLVFAIAGLVGAFLAGYVVYRFRARKGPSYVLSIFFLGLTALGIYMEVTFFGYWPYLFLFTSLILWSVIYAHSSRLVGQLDLRSSFRGIRGGRILFSVSLLLFIFGTYRMLSPAFPPAVFDATLMSQAQAMWLQAVLPAVAFFTLALVLFSVLTMFGSKHSFLIAYGFLIVFSAYGLFGLVHINFAGFWAPTEDMATVVWATIAVLLFYEPTFRFVNHYTMVPFSFSLEYRLRLNRNLLKGRYEIINKGGRTLTGGFAATYKGVDTVTNSEVALKQPRFDSADPNSAHEAIKQLQKESDSLKTLDFPGIVKYFDYFQESGAYFMVEEWVHGETLKDEAGGKGFQESDVLKYTREILYALNYLHMHGILHRDLSCNNVMITSRGKIKLIDFGMAKRMVRMASTGFRPGQSALAGTPGYAPPELDQALVGPIQVSYSYDVYSVGALMYLMLTGKPPPAVLTARQIDGALGGTCDIKIVSVVKKAMAIDPQDRYQSIFEMIAALNGYVGKFIVTDFGEVYDLSSCSPATLLCDPDYQPVPGRLFNSQDKIHLRTRTKKMAMGSLTLNNSVNQYELVAEKGNSFNLLSRDSEKNNVRRYFLGKTALFWLDDGKKDFRNGVFSYMEV